MRFLLFGTLVAFSVMACASGSETWEEVCEYGTGKNQDAAMNCFAHLDRDDDGALSVAELDRLPRTRGRFEELDDDGSGSINLQEFQNGQETLIQRSGAKGG